MAVHVDDTARVKQGELLVDLDPADSKIAQAAAAAELARTVRQVRGLYAQGSQLRAQIAERESALAQAKADYDRRKNLTHDGAVSREELAHVRDAATQIERRSPPRVSSCRRPGADRGTTVQRIRWCSRPARNCVTRRLP